MTPSGPEWTAEQLEADRQLAITQFREQRMREPLEAYSEAFDAHRDSVEELLELTADLSRIRQLAVDVLTKPELLDAVRYLAGPSISTDDLALLAEVPSLAAGRFRKNPEEAQRVIETVLLGLDRNRFPWVGEDREPEEFERNTAAVATAALLANSYVVKSRRTEANAEQERRVREVLEDAGMHQVKRRPIRTWDDAPARGEFCGESQFGPRKADLVVRLWDGRVMPVECKVSNSYVNSIKRLNNDAAAKAVEWIRDFGTRQTVPAALLAGVYKLSHLQFAQSRGLTIFWSHRLDALISFVNIGR